MDFIKPDFPKKNIELRYENGVFCIYGTADGLKQISDLCLKLIQHPQQGHIHLEQGQFLTSDSEKGVIAIFDKTARVQTPAID